LKIILVTLSFLALCSCQTVAPQPNGTSVQPYAFGQTFRTLATGNTLVFAGAIQKGKVYTVNEIRKGGSHMGQDQFLINTDKGEERIPFKSKLVKKEGEMIHIQRIFTAPITGTVFMRSHSLDKEEIERYFPNVDALRSGMKSKVLTSGGEKITTISEKDLKSKFEDYTNPVPQIEMSATLSPDETSKM